MGKKTPPDDEAPITPAPTTLQQRLPREEVLVRLANHRKKLLASEITIHIARQDDGQCVANSPDLNISILASDPVTLLRLLAATLDMAAARFDESDVAFGMRS